MAGKPYSKMGKYVTALSKARKRSLRKKEAEDNLKGQKIPITKRRQDELIHLGEWGYYDLEDRPMSGYTKRASHPLYKNNRAAFDERIQHMDYDMKSGTGEVPKWRDYQMERAVKRSKERQKNGR